MASFVVTTQITYRYLMRKKKSDLAFWILKLLDYNKHGTDNRELFELSPVELFMIGQLATNPSYEKMTPDQVWEEVKIQFNQVIREELSRSDCS